MKVPERRIAACLVDGKASPLSNSRPKRPPRSQSPLHRNLEEAELKRQRQALEMQRERILSERTSSPHRRSSLELALADIEEKLSELGWTIHL